MFSALVAGVDEVGRGPLAGPVVAGAVILAKPIEGLKDSKKLTRLQREKLYEKIITEALSYGIGSASSSEIDRINILQASLLAMRRAVFRLKAAPQLVLVDGNQDPHFLELNTKCIVHGDALEPAISAASILAKVTRDRWMDLYDQRYPGYGFKAHKGYGTRQHLEALKALGPCAIHRLSFTPVSNLAR